jgi:hypothetical protein
VSCARANAPLNTTTAAQAKAWGKTLLNKDRFVIVFLLRLKSCSQLYLIGRGWPEAVIGNNPAGGKKFRGPFLAPKERSVRLPASETL